MVKKITRTFIFEPERCGGVIVVNDISLALESVFEPWDHFSGCLPNWTGKGVKNRHASTATAGLKKLLSLPNTGGTQETRPPNRPWFS